MSRQAWRLRFWRLAARDWYFLYGNRIPRLQREIRARFA